MVHYKKDFIFSLYSGSDCRNRIYRTWYSIYYIEMGRNIEFSNHKKKLLIDSFEPDSIILTIESTTRIIGTARIHTDLSKIGYYHKLYKLDSFNNASVCIVTKFMTIKDYRKTNLPYLLALSVVYYCRKHDIQYIIIDCSPNLYGFFEKLGFTTHIKKAESPEYGEIRIMKFNVFSEEKTLLNEKHFSSLYHEHIYF